MPPIPKRAGSEPSLFGTDALTAAASGLGDLLADLDRGLHVVTPTLQLAEGTLCCHFALEVLDCTLDATISNLDLERPTLYCFARISHGGGDMADEPGERKPEASFFTLTSTQSQNPGRPTGIRAPHGARIFEISWGSGVTHKLPHIILRGFCPCAGCQGHSGEIIFQPNKNLDLRDIKPVGNYALSLHWGDHHDSGIYSFEYLHQLGLLVDEFGAEELIELGTLPRGRVVAATPSKA